MSIYLERLIAALKSRARGWSEVITRNPRPGLRAVMIDGCVIREAAISETVSKWLDSLFSCLPKDSRIMDMDGQYLRLCPTVDGMGFQDKYCVVVASEEWPPLEDGGTIPELVFVLNPSMEYGKGARDLPRGFTDAELRELSRGE